jgi:PBP1b-binding outer membrane lipoprotein LpoB
MDSKSVCSIVTACVIFVGCSQPDSSHSDVQQSDSIEETYYYDTEPVTPLELDFSFG